MTFSRRCPLSWALSSFYGSGVESPLWTRMSNIIFSLHPSSTLFQWRGVKKILKYERTLRSLKAHII